MDVNQWLKANRACGPYGARLGRADRIDPCRDWAVPVRLARVDMEDGDYDLGGAYWGGWSPTAGGMYAAVGDGFAAFTRALSREAAAAKLAAKYPAVRFRRGGRAARPLSPTPRPA